MFYGNDREKHSIGLAQRHGKFELIFVSLDVERKNSRCLAIGKTDIPASISVQLYLACQSHSSCSTLEKEEEFNDALTNGQQQIYMWDCCYTAPPRTTTCSVMCQYYRETFCVI